jgi:hypothetical protein
MKVPKILTTLFTLIGISINAQTVNSELLLSKVDSDTYKITPSISLESSGAKLGNATIRFAYDTDVFNVPNELTEGDHYKIHNFSDGDYFPLKIAKTSHGTIAINVLYKMGPGTNVGKKPVKIASIFLDVNIKRKVKANHIKWELAEFFSPGSFHKWKLGDLTQKFIKKPKRNSNEVAKRYELMGNYPNPFNPTTSIKYHLPSRSKLSIEVYDILGRKVTQLFNGTKQSGTHQITWDASNIASGNYFLRFNAESINGEEKFKKVKKMILLK